MVIIDITSDKAAAKNILDLRCMTEDTSEVEPVEQEFPSIIPCYFGKELSIDQDLVNAGFSAIAIKHHSKYTNGHKRSPNRKHSGHQHNLIHSEHSTEESRNGAFLCHRNSFWNVHRPELTKLKWKTTLTQRSLEELFNEHALRNGTDCTSLCSSLSSEGDLTVIHPPSPQYSEEDNQHFRIPGKRAIELSDEDLNPENTVHRSQAMFCVTIGQLQSSQPKTTTAKTVGRTLSHDIKLINDKLSNTNEDSIQTYANQISTEETEIYAYSTMTEEEEMQNIIVVEKPGKEREAEQSVLIPATHGESVRILLQPRTLNNVSFMEDSSCSEIEMSNIIPKKKRSE